MLTGGALSTFVPGPESFHMRCDLFCEFHSLRIGSKLALANGTGAKEALVGSGHILKNLFKLPK